MQIVKPTTKEQLIDYLIKHVSLGTYDRRFLDNLLFSNITTMKPVTTNQSDLLDTITKRYHRQLAKKELDSNELAKLPWKLAPVASLPQYTQAHISIEDDVVVLRSPYKKEFVKSIKELEWVTWHKEDKTWTVPATEQALKDLINLTEGHYTDVNYCPIATEIINSLAEYEAVKYWNPTLTRINGNLYIVACNQKLMDALADMPIDLTMPTLAKLTHLGIEVSQDVVTEIYESIEDGDRAVKDITFALDPRPVIEATSIDAIIDRLRLINADMVLLVGWYSSNRGHLMELANTLKAHEIVHHISSRNSVIDVDFKQYNMPVKIELGISGVTNDHHIAKVIRLVNNNPVVYK